jgi:hypothetical protein
MKRGDFVWIAALVAVVCVFMVPATHTAIIGATRTHPYPMGFAKFAVLATLGELLGLRVKIGEWKRPVGLLWRVFVWGVMGALLVLVFQVFSAGVRSALSGGLLPAGNGMPAALWVAFWISVVMNLTWAPTLMVGHRLTDAYIELTCGHSHTGRVRFVDVIAHIDWQMCFGFVVARTIPFFWIPAHTLTFLVPPEYRVLMAAFLSIALGAILAFAARAIPPKLPETTTDFAEQSLSASGR